MNRRNFLGLLSCAPLAAIPGMWQKRAIGRDITATDGEITQINPFDLVPMLDDINDDGVTHVRTEFVRLSIDGKLYDQIHSAPIVTDAGRELYNRGSVKAC